MKNQRNRELTEKFNRLFPGGHTNFRRTRMEASPTRIFLTRGEGAHVWDVDGNEYIDYMGGLGPNILGHRHPEFVQTLKNHLDNLHTCSGSGVLHLPIDIELAEKLVQHIPCAEAVKFSVTGSEAVQMAIRLARAYTKRRYFIRFENHYHGWIDNVLGGVYNKAYIGKPFGVESVMDWGGTEGKDPDALYQSFVLRWNNIEELETIIKKYGQEIAMIHFEGIVCNHWGFPPRPGYLERMRELCTEYGIVMSMDEVITGFRVGLNGAQGVLGVTPDMSTLGKAMGGGVPISVCVGKREIMDLLRGRRVLGPGTFMGHPLGMTAALACIGILERDNGAAYKEMAKKQKRLEDGLREIFKRRGVTVLIQGPLGALYTIFGVDKEIAYDDDDLVGEDSELLDKFRANMNEEGVIVMLGGRWYMTTVHTDADIDKTLEAADRSAAKL